MTKNDDLPTFAHRRRKSAPSQRELTKATQEISRKLRKPKPPTLPAPLKLSREK